MSAAFTAGPWSVGPPHVVAQRRTDDEGRRTTRFVAEAVLSAPFVDGEREANARLIAAAPELYAAMAEFVERVDRGEVRSIKTYNKFKALLAKARGEAA